MNLQSQLVLCRHILPKGVELWLLQPQSSRVQDSARRAMSNFLAAEAQLLAGQSGSGTQRRQECQCGNITNLHWVILQVRQDLF